MAKFPIQYSQTIPSVVPMPRAQLDVRGGEEYISRALFGVSEELQGIADNIYRQEAAAEASEGKRKIEEIFIAAVNSASGDDKADRKSWENLQADLGEIKYKKPGVNAYLQEYINTRIPNVKDTFDKTHLAIKKRNAHDKRVLELTNHLGNGNLKEAKSNLDMALATDDISETAYEYQVKNLIPDSLLEQSRRLSASDRPEDRIRAEKILQNLPYLTDAKGEKYELSTEKLEYRNKLLKILQKTSTEKSDAAITSVVLQKDKLKDAPVLEKSNAADQMKQELVNGGVTGDKLNQWFDILDKWSEGGKDPTEEYDPQIYAGLQATCDLNPNSISEAQIYAFVGLGEKGGITINQAKSLVQLRQRNIDEVGSLQNEIHRRYQGILKAMQKAEIFGEGKEGALAYAERANALTVFANTNKEATVRDYEDFFTQLTEEDEKQGWLKFGIKGITYFSPISIISRGAKKRAKLKKMLERVKTPTIETKTDEELIRAIMSK